jgi:putative FmdB family regulatory protein
MPIYAYLCEACGHRQDVLQRMSDPVLSTCPSCGAQRFAKQLTAAGFQLKGSGWYATDFRGGAKPPADDNAAAKPSEPPAAAAAGGTAATTAAPPATAAAPAPSTASAKPRPGASDKA